MKWWWAMASTFVALLLAWVVAQAQQPGAPPTPPSGAPAGKGAEEPEREFPPFQEVTKGFREISPADGDRGLLRIWTRERDGQLLAELPPGYESQRFFIALTVASGEPFAGLQAGELYAYWRRYGRSLALIEPNVEVRATREEEAKLSVRRLFTDRVLAEVPIVTLGPSGQPVFDLDALLVGQAPAFFGPRVQITRPSLVRVVKAKVFPENVEISIEAPLREGRLRSLHYSISRIPEQSDYRPRMADPRVGYLLTSFEDFSRYEDETTVRYINRWHLEKGDPKLEKSLPRKPIVFYIEHTTPVRYRRWVREGVLYWNKAFEKVGIVDAIEVYFQDAKTGAHMEKDPEDVRYNFIRWLNNNEGTAIGPSRVHPLTGQILDADIILTDGWIRYYWFQYQKILPRLAMTSFGPATLEWLQTHPNWDPRVRFAPRGDQRREVLQRTQDLLRRFSGHPAAEADARLIGDEEYDGLVRAPSQANGVCFAADGKALDVGLLRMYLALLTAQEAPEKKEGRDDKEKKGEPKGNLLDGIPEEFIGPLVAEVVAHEVGHTLGLRHNFKASSIYRVEEINSPRVKGKPFAGSVMDYLPINIRMEAGEQQGDYAMVSIGPYDEWAIEYGYAPDDQKAMEALKRVAAPELTFGTDEDIFFSSDPHCDVHDLGANSIEYGREQMKLIRHHRERLLSKFVKDGESWEKARQGYELTLALQLRALRNAVRWVGGAYLHRDKKGDPNGRPPIVPVDAPDQRVALRFVLENAFRDEAFGLTPELARYLRREYWTSLQRPLFVFELEWPVHDVIMSVQATVLTLLMEPERLRRVFDNEFYTKNHADKFTMSELLQTLTDEIWSELQQEPSRAYTAADPMISSLRRNLQREHLERLMDLALPGSGYGAASKAIVTVSLAELRRIQERIQRTLKHPDKLDPYTAAHLAEANMRLEKFFNSQYIYGANPNINFGGGMGIIILGRQATGPAEEQPLTAPLP